MHVQNLLVNSFVFHTSTQEESLDYMDDSSRDYHVEIKDDYTRVTEVLYPLSGLSSIDPNIVANAARRGTRVHDVCEAIVKGLGTWDIDEEISGYVKSFEKWWSQGHKVLAVEKRFYCSELMITGQVDMIIEHDDGAIILDIKTSYKPSKTWPLQGAAYAYMARKHGYNIKGIHFLHLDKKGGDPKVYIYDDEFELFKKCLDIYNYFFKPMKKKVKK